MTTTVWLFKPRSHGRKREDARARNGAPLPGRLPSFRFPHRSVSPAFCARVGTQHLFRRRASSFVRVVWCPSSAALLPAAVLCERARCAWRAGRVACRAACSRVALPCCPVACGGCGCCFGGVRRARCGSRDVGHACRGRCARGGCTVRALGAREG